MDPAILLEDDSILVVDKPAGMIVHDGKDSLSAWLLKHDPSVEEKGWPEPARAGIVHRLDQDTSGVVVLAKTPDALVKLQQSFRNHDVKKIYWALVYGHPDPEQGSVEVAIGRHPTRKTPMSVIPVEEVARGKVRPAKTDYKVLKKFKDVALVEVTIHTGRTHQIRLHMKYIGHPILGDNVYGIKLSKRLSKSMDIHRQMLHAKTLGFQHPETGERCEVEATLPRDFKTAMNKMK